MIIRFVKMTFHTKHVDAFESLFLERKEQIGSFEGCRKVELLRQTQVQTNTSVYFTRSIFTLFTSGSGGIGSVAQSRFSTPLSRLEAFPVRCQIR